MSDEVTGEPKAPVPYARFQAQTRNLQAEIRGAKAETAAAAARIAELEPKAATADAHLATIAELRAAHESATTAWTEERGLLSHGVTDADDVAVARTLYGRVPAETRPKTIGEYLDSLKAEGAAVPKPLAHLFGTKPAEGGGGIATTVVAPPPVRPNPAGAGAAPSNGAKPGAAMLQKARSDFADGKITSTQLQAVLDASRQTG